MLEILYSSDEDNEFKKDDKEISIKTSGVKMPSFLMKSKPAIVGIGGVGNNFLLHIEEKFGTEFDYIAIDTDKEALGVTNGRMKSCYTMQIGEELTKGLGCAAAPEIGMKAFEESQDKIEYCIAKYKKICLVCGLGGGIGTGICPSLFELIQKHDIEVSAFVTLPFKFEAITRKANANSAKERLLELSDNIFVYPNDLLLEKSNRDASLPELLKKASEDMISDIYTWSYKK